MPIIYSDEAIAARMEATCNLMKGGAIEIGTAGMATVLARIPLPAQCCHSDGDEITCNPPEGTFALADGRAAVAQIVDARGGLVMEPKLTVGQSKADVILDYVSLKKGQIVTVEGASFKHA